MVEMAAGHHPGEGGESDPPGGGAESPLPLRELTDPQAMRALAHPRRIELLELLHVDGPLTASQCAARLDDSAASCSYHLRQLAKYGFVEEADDAPRSTGRDRPWRAARSGLTFGTNREDMTPAQLAAAELLEGVVDDRRLSWLARWQQEVRAAATRDPNGAAGDPRAEWVRASFASDFGFWATPEELEEVSRRLHEVLVPFQRRAFEAGEARPDDPRARFVTFLLYGFPRSNPDA